MIWKTWVLFMTWEILYLPLANGRALQQGRPVCDYGAQPGYWEPNPKSCGTYNWQLHDPKCQIQDLMSPYLMSAGDGSQPDVKRVLFIGDSVDLLTVEHFCLQFNVSAVAVRPEEERGRMSGLCANVSNLILMKRHISGANLEGPYWQEFNFPALESIDQGFTDFQNWTHGPPDIVIVSSNFWDLANVYYAANYTTKGTFTEDEVISSSTLREWKTNFTAVLTHVKEHVGRGVPLIYHTMHQPKHDKEDTGSWASEEYIAQHVSQLNAAGRQIAHDLGYDILDIELMTAQVHPSTYLGDPRHQAPWLSLEILNVILNIAAARSRQSQIRAHSAYDMKCSWMSAFRSCRLRKW